MKRSVPLNKQSKKNQRVHYAARRGTWYGLSPVTRVTPDRKKYDRNRMKREGRRSFAADI